MLVPSLSRRAAATLALAASSSIPLKPAFADMAYQPALAGKDYGKQAMEYSDFQKTSSGLLFKDAKVGTGKTPAMGDRVVVDWSGYTIGYFGRPFETKKLVELDGMEKIFFRFELGTGAVLPGFEEGVASMSEGGVRQIVVPYANKLRSESMKALQCDAPPASSCGDHSLTSVSVRLAVHCTAIQRTTRRTIVSALGRTRFPGCAH